MTRSWRLGDWRRKTRRELRRRYERIIPTTLLLISYHFSSSFYPLPPIISLYIYLSFNFFYVNHFSKEFVSKYSDHSGLYNDEVVFLSCTLKDKIPNDLRKFINLKNILQSIFKIINLEKLLYTKYYNVSRHS